MNEVKRTLSLLHDVKTLVKNKDSKYINHTIINNYEINQNTVSIVMTSHNRSKQVYYTLKSISWSKIKDIQIILVDDSTTDPVNPEILKEFPFYIDFISIQNKFWKNPCVNYNIGFDFVQGSKILIQNSEVCHVNDVIQTLEKIQDNEYFVFDVRTSPNFSFNDIIYSKEKLNEFPVGLGGWYQHHIHRNACYHFLTALTRNTFDIVKGFSYDYAFLSWYDDDDLVFKIRNLNIKIINIKNETEKVGGIHLFHQTGSDTTAQVPRALELFNKKKEYFSKNGKYFEISDGETCEELIQGYDNFNK